MGIARDHDHVGRGIGNPLGQVGRPMVPDVNVTKDAEAHGGYNCDSYSIVDGGHASFP